MNSPKYAIQTLISVEANDRRVRDDMAATLALQRAQGVPVWDFEPKKDQAGRQ